MRALEKYLAPLRRRISNMIARGVVRAIDDAGGYQLIQADLLADETQDGIERFQPYGLTACPPIGAEAVVIYPSGNRDHPIAIMVEDRATRMAAVANSEATDGDTVLYTTNDNFIRLQAADGKIYITAPDNVIIKSDKVLRLEGTEGVEIYSPIKVKLDAGGRGFDYLPTNQVNWVVGSLPDVPMIITPDEHPPDPAS